MNATFRTVFAAGLTAALSAACATRANVAGAPPPGARVETASLIARGCYGCLQSAFTLATAAGSRQAAFEAAALLAARSKELGLPARPWIDEARVSLPPGGDWSMYLDIVTALLPDTLSGERDALLNETMQRRTARDMVAGWREDLKSGAGSPPFRAYLDLALACGFQVPGRDTAIDAALEAFGDLPLVVYRAALCGMRWPSQIAAMRAADAQFVDAELPMARRALDASQQIDQEEALRRFGALRPAFPDSPMIPASIGSIHQDREEWTEALDAYEQTLSLAPAHQPALLGRAVSLSNLGRHEGAVATASRLLDAGEWLVGAAHFWRAWNNYHLGDIAAARADVDRAKTLMVNAPTFVLSGMIDWRQKRLETSEAEFMEALKVDAGQCEAAALLGSIRTETRRWPEALAAFAQARQCFDLTVAVRRELIRKIATGPGSEEGKARLIANQERAIAEAAGHRDDAAQNAAQIRKRMGAPTSAPKTEPNRP